MTYFTASHKYKIFHYLPKESDEQTQYIMENFSLHFCKLLIFIISCTFYIHPSYMYTFIYILAPCILMYTSQLHVYLYIHPSYMYTFIYILAKLILVYTSYLHVYLYIYPSYMYTCIYILATCILVYTSSLYVYLYIHPR